LGLAWILVLGIAYRSHVARSFWMRPLAILFYGSFLAAALWHAPRTVDSLLTRYDASPATVSMSRADWWNRDWATLPAQRNERDARRRWPLDLQVAGPLEPLRSAMLADGWRVQPQADWLATIALLDDDVAAQEQAVLPATLDAHAEALLLLRDGERPGEQFALRLWAAPAS